MSDEVEEWRAVPGWEGYEASSLGRIKHLARVRPHNIHIGRTRRLKEKILVSKTGNRYCRVQMGWPKTIQYVHRIVLMAFSGPPPDGKEECRHLDGDSYNNRPDNLEWGDGKDNAADRRRHGTQVYGQDSPVSKLNDFKVRAILGLVAQGVAQYKIAHLFGVSQPTINLIALGRTWKYIERPPTVKSGRRGRLRAASC